MTTVVVAACTKSKTVILNGELFATSFQSHLAHYYKEQARYHWPENIRLPRVHMFTRGERKTRIVYQRIDAHTACKKCRHSSELQSVYSKINIKSIILKLKKKGVSYYNWTQAVLNIHHNVIPNDTVSILHVPMQKHTLNWNQPLKSEHLSTRTKCSRTTTSLG